MRKRASACPPARRTRPTPRGKRRRAGLHLRERAGDDRHSACATRPSPLADVEYRRIGAQRDQVIHDLVAVAAERRGVVTPETQLERRQRQLTALGHRQPMCTYAVAASACRRQVRREPGQAGLSRTTVSW
jgi:hypothetical protein